MSRIPEYKDTRKGKVMDLYDDTVKQDVLASLQAHLVCHRTPEGHIVVTVGPNSELVLTINPALVPDQVGQIPFTSESFPSDATDAPVDPPTEEDTQPTQSEELPPCDMEQQPGPEVDAPVDAETIVEPEALVEPEAPPAE